MAYSHTFKVILTGEPYTGKSSILLKYTENIFLLDYQSTIGLEYGSKLININGNIIKLQLWDTAGQETFQSITRSYYNDAAIILLVYDITSRSSFTRLYYWLDEIKKHSNNPIIFLIGNKNDLYSQRKISTEEAINFAKSYNLIFHEISAKNDNLNKLFHKIGGLLNHKIINKEIIPGFVNNNIKVTSSKKYYRSCCNIN